ncbi:MAG: hypothetical protein GTO14_16495 [Anaerolineales bacterium]|nr:hypothetical protein [Anaerolineales bacterium]
MTTDFVTLFAEGLQALGRHYRSPMQEAISAAKLEPPEWYVLFTAYCTAPKPISASELSRLSPYNAVSLHEQRLQGAIDHGYLIAEDGEAYQISEEGRRAAVRPIKEAQKALGSLSPLPEEEMARLVELLRRLVEAVIEAPEPSEKPALLRSRVVDPGEGAQAATRIDQYLTDLTFYRDDAHIAAWKPYEIPGQTWETLTLIWREEAHTLDELAERLEARGQTKESLSVALEDLVDRGWISTKNGGYTVTEQGSTLRQEAEEATDRFYYDPWSALKKSERAEMEALLVKFKEALTPPEEEGEE